MYLFILFKYIKFSIKKIMLVSSGLVELNYCGMWLYMSRQCHQVKGGLISDFLS